MQLPQATIRLVVGLTLLVPLSYVIRYLPSRKIREAYSLITGLLMQYWVFRESMLPVYAQHLIVYALIKLRGRKSGAIVTCEAILFLSGYQIYLMVYSYGQFTMSAEALVMILVCKYSLFAYNIQDGALPEEKCSIEQKKYRIIKDTSFLDFIGYVTFLPTCLIGPPLQFNDYDEYLTFEGTSFQNVPSVWPIVFVSMGETVLFVGLYAVEQMFFPVMALAKADFYLNDGAYILFYTFISVTLTRSKYYFGWKLSIAGIHASGITWNGENFRRMNIVNPKVVQQSPHIRQKINHWNIMVQEWLRKCIYQRSGIKNRTLSQIWVFLISSIWHGFYEAYYLSFFFWFVQLHLQGLIFKFTRNPTAPHMRLFHKMGIFGTIIAWVLVNFMFNHNAVFFQILDFEACKLHLAKFHYIPQIVLIALTVVFSFIKPPKKKHDHSNKPHEEEKQKLTEQKTSDTKQD